MKLWVIAVLLALLAPMNAFAQDIEETPLVSVEQDADTMVPPVVNVTEPQKIEFIIDTVRRMSSGSPKMQAMQNPEEIVTPEYIEALIHSEGPDAIRKYHASVRTMMKDNLEWTKYESLMLTINEIKMLGPHMKWKAMRSHLISLDRYSEKNFPIWSKNRVESWLVQAETILYLRPNSEDKKRAIEGLIAKVRLAQKTNEELEYDFTISDRVLDIEEGVVLEAKEDGKSGFFGKWIKKLKFW